MKLFSLPVAVCIVLTPGLLVAQSGSVTRSSPVPAAQVPAAQGSAAVGSGSASVTGSGSATSGSGRASRIAGASMPVGLGGYCPVSIIDMKKWVKGSPQYAVLLDGKKYLFLSEEQRQKFLRNTTQYTPALGGDCVVCMVAGGARTPGSIYHSVIHKNRLFIFPSDKEKAKFMADPGKYENVDLGLDGMCPVCRVELNELRPGDPQVGTVFGGKRYYFPSMDQKKIFLSNPRKYANPT